MCVGFSSRRPAGLLPEVLHVGLNALARIWSVIVWFTLDQYDPMVALGDALSRCIQ